MEGFQWPEPTDEMLRAIRQRAHTTSTEDMRDAIHLDRQLLAGVNPNVARLAWVNNFAPSAASFAAWILTRGGTVEPLPPPVPTLAEALEAARLLGGEAAEVVTCYLQAQQQEGQSDG